MLKATIKTRFALLSETNTGLSKSSAAVVHSSGNNFGFQLNNFDLIRLFAAIQVTLHHSLEHLNLKSTLWLAVLQITDYFPGVPVFFFVSGFLISKSFERNPQILEYARNRILRIYPALLICVGATTAVVWALGYLSNRSFSPFTFVAWVIAQMTIVQFYNPDFMRDFGVGVLNGSLWTITVELQFYILTPLLYLAINGCKMKNRNAFLLILLVAFLAINRYSYTFQGF